MKKIQSILAIVLVLSMALFWFRSQREGSHRAPDFVDNTNSKMLTTKINDDPGPASELHSPEPQGERVLGAAEERTAQASVVRVIDLHDDAPIPNLAYEAFALGPQKRSLAQGKTDAEGCIPMASLPAQAFYIRTERQPPHAAGIFGFDPENYEGNEPVMRVGHGGAIKGRIVDGKGNPLKGVNIYSRPQWYEALLNFGAQAPLSTEQLLATSDPDGFFIAKHLLSRPRRLEWVGGVFEPTIVDAVALECENPFLANVFGAQAKQSVLEGEEIELLDPLVIKSSIFLTGRVVNGQGAPVPGVMVTSNYNKRPSPTDSPPCVLTEEFPFWEDGFELQPGETLTGQDGSFQLKFATRPRYNLRVISRASAVQAFSGLLQYEAIGSPKSVELRLHDSPVLSFDLQELDGSPLELPRESKEKYKLENRPGHSWSRSKSSVNVTTIFASGEISHGAFRMTKARRLRMVYGAPPEEIRAIKLSTGEHRLTVLKYPNGIDATKVQEVRMQRWPSLLLTIDPEGGTVIGEEEHFQLSVHACMAGPEGREERFRYSSGGRVQLGRRGCCGLGCAWVGDWSGQAMDLAMPVLTLAPYWIYVTGRGETFDLPLLTAGPFLSGEAHHSVRIGLATLAKPIPPPEEDVQWVDYGDPDRPRVELSLVDAETGRAPEQTHTTIRLVPGLRGRQSAGLNVGKRVQGSLRANSHVIGRFQITIECRGYQPVDLGVRDLFPGSVVDLGCIEIQSAPVFHALLLDSYGAPVPDGYRVEILRRTYRAGLKGLLAVTDHLPGSFVIECIGEDRGLRVVEVNGWDPDETLQLQVPASRTVEFVVRGLAPDHDYAYLRLRAQARLKFEEEYENPLHLTEQTRLRRSQIRLQPRPGYESGTRRFRATLGVGEYSILATSTLYDVSPAEFEVAAGPGIQTISLQATRH